MAPQTIDALFIPYYYDMDRWYNDGNGHDKSLSKVLDPKAGFSRKARMMREGVGIDGKLYDFSRFLSWVRYDSTLEYERYDSYSLTLLSGSYYMSLLRRHGVDVHSVNSVNRESLESLGRQYVPRFVLLSTTLLLEHLLVREAVTNIRRIWPEAVIVVGGLFLVELEKTTPKEQFFTLLRHYNADAYVASPQGEFPLLEILKRGSREALLDEGGIPNTYVLANNKVYEPTSKVEPPMEMSENYVRWRSIVQENPVYHTVHTRTARSCAFNCAFCNFPVNQGALTLMNVEDFEKELQELRACGEVRSLIFTDDTFNVPLRRFKELCKVLAKYDFEWYSFYRAQYADKETAKLMKAANCRAVFLGIESADDQILQNMNKVAKIETIKRGVEQLKKLDILTHANFIVGFPGDTEETSRKLVDFLDEMEIDFFTLAPWVYVPSTPISQRKEEFGVEGEWNSWSHKTMNSTEAFDLTEQLIKEPKFSVHAPELAANEFWAEILLYCNDFTREEAQHAFSTFNHFMGKDTPATKIKVSSQYQKLRSILMRREMPRPKNY